MVLKEKETRDIHNTEVPLESPAMWEVVKVRSFVQLIIQGCVISRVTCKRRGKECVAKNVTEKNEITKHGWLTPKKARKEK